MINLQTFASQLTALSEELKLENLILKVAEAPRQLLQLDIPKIDIDEKANLTLFDPNSEWEFKADNNFSKSKNSPWLNKKLKGKAVAVFNNGKMKVED